MRRSLKGLRRIFFAWRTSAGWGMGRSSSDRDGRVFACGPGTRTARHGRRNEKGRRAMDARRPGVFCGAGDRNRTRNPLITNQLRYRCATPAFQKPNHSITTVRIDDPRYCGNRSDGPKADRAFRMGDAANRETARRPRRLPASVRKRCAKDDASFRRCR